jgi:hypothetical protein
MGALELKQWCGLSEKCGGRIEEHLRLLPLGGMEESTDLSADLNRLDGENYGTMLLKILVSRLPDRSPAILDDARAVVADHQSSQLAETLITAPAPAEPEVPTPGPAQHGEGATSSAAGATAEERIQHYLGTHPNPPVGEAMESTGLKEQQIRRTQAWKDHEERLLDDYLRTHPSATTTDVQRDLGFSPSKTVEMNAWGAHKERKNAAKPAPQIKERPLTDTTEKLRPDERAVDPGQQIEQRDRIFRELVERAAPRVRGQLNRLAEGDRDRLIDYLLCECDSEQLGTQDPDRRLTIVLTVAESWLDEHAQERMHSDRKSRRS